jgi:AraC-like DNA-binding protein
MEYKLIEKRDKIIKDIWQNYKAELSMKDLAIIFGMTLPTLYRILKADQVNQPR